ncbi:MAG: FMN-binding protein [Ruminococcaceae bacterium]|nr:FMN-binding protein [Oscillospiraceae bacterium]
MKKTIMQVLFVLVVLSAMLWVLNIGLSNIAQTNAEAAELRIMQALLPGSATFTEEPYTGTDSNIRTVYKGDSGFVVETAAQGYADEIVMLIGVNKDGEVMGLVVKDMHETLGLGAKALREWEFLAQYLYTTGEAEVGADVDALTGATVTSKAINRCVNSAVAYVTGADVGSGATSWGG